MRRLNPNSQPESITLAARRLAEGGLVALPTETVYGLGARADDDEAVARIYRAKGRPSGHPLIVHVAQPSGGDAFAAQVPALARVLMQRWWPGPLTLILPRRPGVAVAAAGGQPTIGLRCPDHPVAHALLQACAELGVAGVAAPSANRFGRVSPTLAAHVQSEFEGQGAGLDEVWVLDGGTCAVGIESAIVDLCGPQPLLLRPGALTLQALQDSCGQPLAWSRPEAPLATASRAPGTLLSHYAPRARVRVFDRAALQQALQDEAPSLLSRGGAALGLAIYARTEFALGAQPQVRGLRMPGRAIEAAQALFADLRTMDDWGVSQIWVEAVPAQAEWDGVRDRLARAAA